MRRPILLPFLQLTHDCSTPACIFQDLVITKWHAYGLDRNSLKLLYDYLKGHGHKAKLVLVTGVPHGSVHRLMLLNTFVVDFS